MIDAFLTKLSSKYRVDLHYFAKGGFWLSLTQGITILGGLATSVVFAHTLSETSYGTYQYLLGIGVLLTSFSLTGIGQSILQAAAQKYTGFILIGIKYSFIYSTGISLAGILGSLYYFVNENNTLAIGCLLIALFQPLLNNFQNIFFYLNGKKQFRESTLLQTVKTLGVTGASLLTIYLTQDILLLLLTYFVAHTLINTLGYIYYKPKGTSFIPEEIKIKYLSYAKHTSIRNIFANVAFRIDTILVFTQLGAAELAVYTIANIIPEQIKGSFKNLALLLTPKYVQQENVDILKKSIPKRSFQLFALLLLITFLYILLAPAIYGLLFPKYESSILLSQIAALSFPAFVLLLPQTALQANLEDRKLHLLTIQSSVVLIFLTFMLIPTLGLIGALLAKIISRYITLLLNYYYLYR